MIPMAETREAQTMSNTLDGRAPATSRVGPRRPVGSRRWVSPARPPNRTCTFRYASGSPKACAKSGAFIHLRLYRPTGT